MTGIEKAIKAAGSAAALARLMGVSKMAAGNWLRYGVPAERVLKVSEFTGVTPHELRPDLYPNVTDAIKHNDSGDGVMNHENQT